MTLRRTASARPSPTVSRSDRVTVGLLVLSDADRRGSSAVTSHPQNFQTCASSASPYYGPVRDVKVGFYEPEEDADETGFVLIEYYTPDTLNYALQNGGRVEGVPGHEHSVWFPGRRRFCLSEWANPPL